ncbi:MAG TPA: hypothetical protein VLL48_04780, partial [Longimicrobiales bacterium]|nr:hypothetical protein [Longimicrobiales bacterium]
MPSSTDPTSHPAASDRLRDRGHPLAPALLGSGLAVVLALLPQGCVDAPASESAAGTLVRVDGLGALAFENSGAPEAQEAFHRGVLLMHSFEYE